MREFRVWCENKDEWETDLTTLMNTGELFHVNTLINEKYKLQPLKKETHIVEFYTGLLDKNGKKIFEGDIDSDGFTFTYNTKMGGWYRMKNGEGFQWHEQCVNKGRLPFEITSNIHE